MKKTILLITSIVLGNFATYAQTEPGILNLGFGVGTGSFRAESGNFSVYKSRVATPALGASYEIAVHPDITIGPYVGFNKVTYRNNDFEYNKNSYTNLWFGARGAYYFDNLVGINDDFDFYAGLALGLSYSNNRQTSDIGSTPISSSSVNFPNLGLFIGGRYWIKDNFGVYAETGLGASWLNIGASLKL